MSTFHKIQTRYDHLLCVTEASFTKTHHALGIRTGSVRMGLYPMNQHSSWDPRHQVPDSPLPGHTLPRHLDKFGFPVARIYPAQALPIPPLHPPGTKKHHDNNEIMLKG